MASTAASAALPSNGPVHLVSTRRLAYTGLATCDASMSSVISKPSTKRIGSPVSGQFSRTMSMAAKNGRTPGALSIDMWRHPMSHSSTASTASDRSCRMRKRRHCARIIGGPTATYASRTNCRSHSMTGSSEKGCSSSEAQRICSSMPRSEGTKDGMESFVADALCCFATAAC